MVVVRTTDVHTGYVDSFTVEVRSRDALSADEVRGRAMAMAADGRVDPQYRSKVQGFGRRTTADAYVISAYQGSPRVS